MLRNDACYQRLPVAVVTGRELDPPQRARLERSTAAVLAKGPSLTSALRTVVEEQISRGAEEVIDS